eukprot:scaffold49451_cov14-Tisochrysis_lutea.AAC.2
MPALRGRGCGWGWGCRGVGCAWAVPAWTPSKATAAGTAGRAHVLAAAAAAAAAAEKAALAAAPAVIVLVAAAAAAAGVVEAGEGVLMVAVAGLRADAAVLEGYLIQQLDTAQHAGSAAAAGGAAVAVAAAVVGCAAAGLAAQRSLLEIDVVDVVDAVA